ncbi:hypothetical protein STRDD10_00991 [Streptococcus sp. DD10]|uniref:hypothetical protein n=1 Tax=Streptococcus sp. DD10 TaxID=1777878 RepID=UPI0007959676|nr:hypothetical protein [Streptococcus sp. DD10]KXT74370.1 hypothetical protein STRDD10_00991 [Streptococcus sp. DD10]
MKKKIVIVTFVTLVAIGVWGLTHNHFGLDVKINYTKTTVLENTDDQEDDEMIYDLLGNRLD